MSEEIKVKTASDEKPAEVAKWPGFDMPSFGSNWFELNPFALMKKFGVGLDHAFHMSMAENGMWAPTVEVKEAGGKFRVSAELPGVKPNDIKVHVSEDAVTLEGERRHEREESRDGMYHSERSYGRFYRSIPLPKDANGEKATASYTNGILEITIPVPESKTKPREIPVKHAA